MTLQANPQARLSGNKQSTRRYKMIDALRSIEDLENWRFDIPSYQRGYRWGKREVEALLEDITDFYTMDKSDFYCLQPIFVKKIDDKRYNVIDGQQRLTTIFIILKYLIKKNFFSLKYHTRKNSEEFLQNIESFSKQAENVNIDFYHFQECYKTVEAFFNNKGQEQKHEFLNAILKKCKVLWYEIEGNENEVFIRLNTGKIPLSEEENIKALFLAKNDSVDSDDLKEMAEFWYETEIKTREEDDFRYGVLCKINEEDLDYDKAPEKDRFIVKDEIMRIGVYLNAISKGEGFDYFYRFYKKDDLAKKWREFELAIRTLQSFTSRGNKKIDREIFHYFGFLILSGYKVHELYQVFLELSQNSESYRDYLFNKVKVEVSKSILELDDLSYLEKDDKEKLKKILLLFNLNFLIQEEDSNEYFKFNRFQTEQWSLEHIYAQNSKSIKDAIIGKDSERIRGWLLEVVRYMDELGTQNNLRRLTTKIKKFSDSSSFDDDQDQLNELIKEIDDVFAENIDLNSIQNLTLLDKKSNSSIGNAIFSIKREKIQKLAEKDRLIPIATKKVFEKVFTKGDKGDLSMFSLKDREDYRQRIADDLKKYIVLENK